MSRVVSFQLSVFSRSRGKRLLAPGWQMNRLREAVSRGSGSVVGDFLGACSSILLE
jgi:hypothetical protein